MNKGRNTSVFFSLSLLFLFAGCTFLLLIAQIQGSHNLQTKLQDSYQRYTPISYVTMKIHSYDHSGGIKIEMIDGIQCLILQDENTKTYIYQEDESLKEYYVIKELTPNLKDGDVLFPCSSFIIKKNENQIIGIIEGEEFIVNIRSDRAYVDD